MIHPKSSLVGAVNCPVDIEIIDKDTNEDIDRIGDNMVGEIFAKENSIVMMVEGDEKSF